ncbi:MAG: cell division protein FtsQ/DivIB [Acidimicrobiales bacterium]
MTATTSARPRIDPRIGRRRVAVTRARGRRRLRLIVAAAALMAFGAGALVVVHSPLLALRKVTVTGAVHTAVAQVLHAGRLYGHPPLVDIDPAAAGAGIEMLPWVDTVSVKRRWPHTVTVAVTERVAIAAMMRRAGGFVLVDVTGRVLAVVGSAPGLPLVAAPVRVGAPGTDLPAVVHGTLSVLSAARGRLDRAVAGASAAAGVVRLELAGGVTALLSGGGDAASQLGALESVLVGAPPTGPETIDVRVPGEVTVTPG